MNYEPIKANVGDFIGRSYYLRKCFYKVFDLLLLRSWHMHREIRIWAREHNDSEHILDAGTGFGQYAYYMAGLNERYNILGIDVKGVNVCDCNTFFRRSKRTNVFFKTKDLTEFVQPNGFDLVVCAQVMHYIKDDQQALENCYTSLKPGGMFLLSTNSDEGSGLMREAQQKLGKEGLAREGYNIQDIKARLRAIGFSKVKARYAMGVPGRIAWRLSIKYPMYLVNLSSWLYILLPFYYLVAFPISYLLNYIDSHVGHTSGDGIIVKAWK